MYIVIMALGCTHEEVSFLSLHDLDDISILLNEDNYFEEEISPLFNEVTIFIFKCEKNTTNQVLSILKICNLIRRNFERFQVCFLVKQQYELVWKHSFLN